MQLSNFSFALLAAVIALTACHSAPPAAPESASGQSQPEAPASTVSTPIASPQQPAQAASHPTKQKLNTSAQNIAQQDLDHESGENTSAQNIAQLDLANEAGVRDGRYAMWVHVTEGGKSVSNLPVLAFNTSNKLAAAARTNEDGDAMLKVQATTYRITATRGRWHAEQTVTYHPGNQFELALRH